MEDKIDEFEEEEESFDKEEEEEETPKLIEKTPKTKTKEDTKPVNKYEPFYVETRIGIMNTVSGEVEQEGFKSVVQAESQAKILNMLDKIAITTGVQ